MKYYSPSTGGFFTKEIHGNDIPNDAIEITDEYHQKLLDLQSSGNEIQFINNTVVAAPRTFTQAELNQREVDTARRYLKDTDFYMTIDKYAQLTEDRITELTTTREAAREVIRQLEKTI